MKKMRLHPVIILLILLILCGAAGAADAPWDLHAVLARENERGEQEVNEELLWLVQDVRQTVSGEYLRITMADALFDGRALAAAWEIESLSEDQLVYVIATETEDSVRWNGAGTFGGMEEFLRPGKTRNGLINSETDEPIQGDTLRVGIRYFVLAPAVEVTYLQFPNWQEEGYMEKIDAMQAEGKALGDEGKLAVITDKSPSAEWLSLCDAFYYEVSEQADALGGECTHAEAMVATGKFRLLEEVEVSFDLKITERPVSFLPNGEPVEKDYGDFTMRITQADYTASTLEIIVEAVFTDEESAKKFSEGNRAFIALNEEGSFSWDRGDFSLGAISRMEARDDGTWIQKFSISHRRLFTFPEYVTVCPTAAQNPGGGIPYDPKEGVVLALR